MSNSKGVVDEGAGPVDGRVARRERNQNAVLDVVLKVFAEDMMFPTIEQASKRSGLSLRSLYRYYADPAELADTRRQFRAQFEMHFGAESAA